MLASADESSSPYVAATTIDSIANCHAMPAQIVRQRFRDTCDILAFDPETLQVLGHNDRDASFGVIGLVKLASERPGLDAVPWGAQV
jgi:hypothetical protein